MFHSWFQIGLSMSYDRFQEVTKKIGNQICKEFLKSGIEWGSPLPESTAKP